jgi:ketosteroid isomerase-like protein
MTIVASLPLCLAIASAVVLPAHASGQAAAAAPLQADLEALLAADRAFAAAAAKTDVVTALTSMFTPDVVVPGPQGLARGLDAVTAALRAVPENLTARATWTPIRGGISADGQHGFTFGYMTVTAAAGSRTELKYMAYWVRGASGWRAAGFKRARRGEGEVSTASMPPHVPPRRVPGVTDAAVVDRHRQSLIAAEQAFSDRAQRLGLGPAFAEYGLPTAVNMGGPARADYVVGAAAIGAAIGASAPGATSPVHWSSEIAIVASSGDLGISFGYIRQHGAPPAGAPPQGQPFFTIWARESPAAPWRYIAE